MSMFPASVCLHGIPNRLNPILDPGAATSTWEVCGGGGKREKTV